MGFKNQLITGGPHIVGIHWDVIAILLGFCFKKLDCNVIAILLQFDWELYNWIQMHPNSYLKFRNH